MTEESESSTSRDGQMRFMERRWPKERRQSIVDDVISKLIANAISSGSVALVAYLATNSETVEMYAGNFLEAIRALLLIFLFGAVGALIVAAVLFWAFSRVDEEDEDDGQAPLDQGSPPPETASASR